MTGQKCISPKTEEGDYVIYKIENPDIIERLKIISYPRVSNDRKRRNFVKASYSMDSQEYKPIYYFKSNRNGQYSGIYEEKTVHTIMPESKVVYLKFDLASNSCQLWSSEDYPMAFVRE